MFVECLYLILFGSGTRDGATSCGVGPPVVLRFVGASGWIGYSHNLRKVVPDASLHLDHFFWVSRNTFCNP